MEPEHQVIEAPALVLPPAGPGPSREMGAERQAADIAAEKVIVSGQQGTSYKWESTQQVIALLFSACTVLVLGRRGWGCRTPSFPRCSACSPA